MTNWISMVTALWLSTASAQISDGFRSLGNIATKELAALKDPLDKTVVSVAFSQCKTAQKILGVEYDQYDEEPDFSKLTLNYFTPSIKIQYNLTTITELPHMPNFDRKKGLTIYMHGFTDDPSKSSYTGISESFIKQGNYNILALDSSSLIKFFYVRATTLVRFIGEVLGKVCATMIDEGLDPASLHFVGHSLGSHIASFAGKTVYNLTGKHVGRISALDPAGPCFANVEAELKISKTDATFVDVMHTDAGVYGLNELVGHVDFNPNSGSEQPGCLLQTCSHSRAWELYADSVRAPDGFPAVRCDSWKAFKKGDCDYSDIRYMGYGARPGGPEGKYFLMTAETSPFQLYAAGLNYTRNDGIVRGIRDHINLWKR